MDYKTETVVFPLWNLSGQLIGTLDYKWLGDKKKNEKYQPHIPKGKLAVYGLDSYDKNKDLYIAEGVWDCIAIQATGRSCIAVLSNNPKHLTSWLRTLPNKIIAVCDGDKAGKMLAKHGDHSVVLPAGKDASDLSIFNLKYHLEI